MQAVPDHASAASAPASASSTPSASGAAGSGDLPAWATGRQSTGAEVDLIFRFILAFFATPIFVALAVAMRQFHVVVLLLVILSIIAFLGAGQNLLERYPVLWKVKILGNALKATNDLDVFYREHRPRSFLLYSIYPLYALVGLVGSRVVRRELKLHAKVVAIVAVLLLLDAAASYGSTFPPYLGPKEAGQLLLTQFLVVLFFSMLYLMPMTTTVYALGLSGKRKTTRALVIGSLLLSIPAAYGSWRGTQGVLPWIEQGRLSARLHKIDFRHDLTEISEMFLERAHAMGWIDTKHPVPQVDAKATARFQRVVHGIVVGVEPSAFEVFGFRTPKGSWSGIRVLLGKRAFLLYLYSPDGEVLHRWSDVPKDAQDRFRVGPRQSARERADAVAKTGLLSEFPVER